MEDIKIIELFNLRDEQAISETDIKYGRSCRRIARDILSDREDAEECVDDTYLAPWNAIPPLCTFQTPRYAPACTSGGRRSCGSVTRWNRTISQALLLPSRA